MLCLSSTLSHLLVLILVNKSPSVYHDLQHPTTQHQHPLRVCWQRKHLDPPQTCWILDSGSRAQKSVLMSAPADGDWQPQTYRTPHPTPAGPVRPISFSAPLCRLLFNSGYSSFEHTKRAPSSAPLHMLLFTPQNSFLDICVACHSIFYLEAFPDYPIQKGDWPAELFPP